jgi:hypothetical protein
MIMCDSDSSYLSRRGRSPTSEQEEEEEGGAWRRRGGSDKETHCTKRLKKIKAQNRSLFGLLEYNTSMAHYNHSDQINRCFGNCIRAKLKRRFGKKKKKKKKKLKKEN